MGDVRLFKLLGESWRIAAQFQPLDIRIDAWYQQDLRIIRVPMRPERRIKPRLLYPTALKGHRKPGDQQVGGMLASRQPAEVPHAGAVHHAPSSKLVVS